MKYLPRYDWFTCPIDTERGDAEGDDPLRVRVLANPTGADVRHEAKYLAGVAKNEGEDGFISEIEYLEAVVSPRVIDWNVELQDAEGNWFKVAAPGSPEGLANPQPDLYYYMQPHQLRWLTDLVRYVHLPKTRASLLAKPTKPSSTDTPITTDETTQTETESQ